MFPWASAARAPGQAAPGAGDDLQSDLDCGARVGTYEHDLVADQFHDALIGLCRRAGFEPKVRSGSLHTGWTSAS
jgi:hypothetical protein